MGTIGFMAPEVLNCTFAEPSTDFFSLGVVAYMLLSGHPPFIFYYFILDLYTMCTLQDKKVIIL